ncbi:MAG: MotA/TolQ/ExbB proton channel family protein [Pyrinomonadaceae bacterium]
MKRFDWTIWLGVAVGLAAIIAGAWFEGLNIGFLWHPTAALIVGGGTLGAVIVRRGGIGVFSAWQAVWRLRYKDETDDAHKVEIARLAWLSRSAQKNGVKTFESYAETCDDALVSQGLILLADDAPREQIFQVLSRRLDAEDADGLQDSATLEAAGAFAPTFGILGAVLGLIGVLRVLDKPDVLGVGIATAFVATIYGIGLANLLFFPLAARLRARHEARMKRREELITVILSLRSNETPRAIINQFNLG